MGKLIVFEGTDGTGKSTQYARACERLEAQNVRFEKIKFPQYDEPSSALIKMYLAGEFGSDPEKINPYAASTFYAVDRYASYQKVWGTAYRAESSCSCATRPASISGAMRGAVRPTAR